MPYALEKAVLALIQRTSTDLPEDVEQALRRARKSEEGAAAGVLGTILENVAVAREEGVPICQDTGTPIFYSLLPPGESERRLRMIIREAVAEATRLAYLRPNAVHPLTGVNSGNNLGDDSFPLLHIREGHDETLVLDLLLKGGGSENCGAQYSLPLTDLKAGRDLDGVRRCVLHAVHQAQGLGCAPGILGVAIGGDRASGYAASKEVLLRPLGDRHPDPVLAELENRISIEANQLGIGPMGFGGQTTVLATRIVALHRLPASYFVSVSYMCWACRRRRLTFGIQGAFIDGREVEV